MSEAIRPPPACTIDIAIDSPRWEGEPVAREGLIRRIVEAALPPDQAACELAVVLTDDDAIRTLNARFRGRDAPTNVLSFPAPSFPAAAPDAALPLGDVVIAFETAQREAAAQGKEFFHHVTLLLVHGVLHLLGYDHQGDAEAELMEMRERAILLGLGIPAPHGDHADAPGDEAGAAAAVAVPRVIDQPDQNGGGRSTPAAAAHHRA